MGQTPPPFGSPSPWQGRIKIHLFGNPLLPFDSLPIKFQPKLQTVFPELEFIFADPTENLHPENKELIIIDSVEGINEVRVLTDINKIETQAMYSLHDFDLGFNLKLLQKIGELERIRIFCLPMTGDENLIFNELCQEITQFHNKKLLK